MRRLITMLIIIVMVPHALSVAAHPSIAPKGIPSNTVAAKVIGAEDGEKLQVTILGEPETVRLIGVDTPEPDNDGKPECFFEESRDHLERMLKGRTVYLERDQSDTDKKKRLLRYVWFVGKSDKKAYLAQELLAQDGFVIFKEEEKDTRYASRLRSAEQTAKDASVGLWSDCGGGHVAVTPVPKLGEGGLPAPIGTTLNTEGQDVTVSNAFFSYDYGFATPKGGYVFLVIDVNITNVDTATKDNKHDYGGNRFSAKDLMTGAEFDDTFTLASGGLGSGNLSPKEYVSGVVVLEVQETGGPIRIKYDANLVGGSEVYWVVDR